MKKYSNLLIALAINLMFVSCNNGGGKYNQDTRNKILLEYKQNIDSLDDFLQITRDLQYCVSRSPRISNYFLTKYDRTYWVDSTGCLWIDSGSDTLYVPKITNGILRYEDVFLRYDVPINCMIVYPVETTDSIEISKYYINAYIMSIKKYISRINEDIITFFYLANSEKSSPMFKGFNIEKFVGLKSVILDSKEEVFHRYSDILFIKYGINQDTIAFNKWYAMVVKAYNNLDLSKCLEKFENIKNEKARKEELKKRIKKVERQY